MVSSAAASARPYAPVVSAQGVSRRYESGLAVRRLSLTLTSGEQVALLGPNGAGKTTLLRLLAALLRPSAGQLRLFGLDPAIHGAAVRARIGVLAHHSMLHPGLTAAENLRYYAGLYDLPDASERVSAVLERIGLTARANDPVSLFSRGMLQRLALGRTLLHGPELLLLDEPDAGLDAHALDVLPRLLSGSGNAPPAVIFTTHQIDRALQLARRVLVLVAGRLVFDGPSAGLDGRGVAALYKGDADGR